MSRALRRRVPGAPPSTWQRGHCPPTVVAVPGLGLSIDGWRGPGLVIAGLRGTGFAVVALPAYGLPARHGEPLDPVTSSGRLLARLDELGADRVALLGHSGSCQVVAEVARRAPERVAALVLVGPTTDPRGRTWPRLAGRWLATAAHERLGQVPLLVRDYSHSGLITFARAMDATRRHPIAPVLAALDQPVLLVRGPHDRIAPASWLDDLVGRRAGIEAVTLPAGGHMVPITHPHDLAAAVTPFLARHTTPSL